MTRYLFIVSRRESELYAYLRSRFEDDDRVQVILDRRQSERRHQIRPTVFADRRGAERRVRDIQRELASAPFAIVTQP